MRTVEPMEIGVMFWAGGDPHETLRELRGIGVRAGQMGVPGELALDGLCGKWKAALEAHDFALATVFCSYVGESYADAPTVERTVGFVPPATRDERERRTLAVSDFARELGVKSIACHIGFVPHDTADPVYIEMRDLVRRIADHAADNGQTFALETGQEPADVLSKFIAAVERDNVGINFDPANMIMYGTGDPIMALAVLAPHVMSVHCKDGQWPAKPGALGSEHALGSGAVGMEQYINKLKQIGYRGILSIEREAIEDPAEKKRDLRAAVELLERLRQ